LVLEVYIGKQLPFRHDLLIKCSSELTCVYKMALIIQRKARIDA